MPSTPCGPTSSRRRTNSTSRRSSGLAPGPGEALIRVTLTTICGTDVHIVKGEYPVRPGPDPRPRAGRRHRGARRRRHRLRGRRARPRRRDHARAASAEACLSGHLSQCGHGDRLRGDRRLALRQHDRRRPGRVPARPVRAGQPGEDPRRRDRRAGRPPRRHRVDRLLRRRVGRRPDRRRRRRVRAGPDRPVRDRRREADGRGAGHRRRQRPGPPRDGASGWAPTSRSTSPRSTSSRRSSG